MVPGRRLRDPIFTLHIQTVRRNTPALDVFGDVPVNDDDLRFVRGGAFYRGPAEARSAHRDVRPATYPYYYNGFRVVRTVTPEQEARSET